MHDGLIIALRHAFLSEFLERYLYAAVDLEVKRIVLQGDEYHSGRAGQLSNIRLRCCAIVHSSILMRQHALTSTPASSHIEAASFRVRRTAGRSEKPKNAYPDSLRLMVLTQEMKSRKSLCSGMSFSIVLVRKAEVDSKFWIHDALDTRLM